MSINLTPLGVLVKVEITGQADQYIKVSDLGGIVMPSDGTSNIIFPVNGQTLQLPSITNISISGVAITNQADWDAKVAENFPKANSGTGGSGVTTAEMNAAIAAAISTAIANLTQA